MPNEKFQTRVPDPLAERIHEYREDRSMSKSEAVRSLMRSGLRAEGAGTDDEQDTDTTIAHSLLANRAVLLTLALFVLLVTLFATRPALQTTALDLASTAIMAFLGAALGVTVTRE